MSAERSKNDQLVANQLRFDVQVRGEPAINNASAKVGSPHEIKIDESHRVLKSPASGEGYAFYLALIVGLLATTCGVVWFILYQSALPVDLTSVSGLSENRNFNPKAISSSLEQNSNSLSARMPDPQKSDRLKIHDTTVGEIARNALAATPQNPNVASVSTTSVSTAPRSRLASKDSTVAPRQTTLTGARVKEVRTTKQRTPTPETRPETIEGWTLREVVNGTAVLEGPNGVWKVTLGQTVPGVGRVDSIVRWGNRLVVATSRGLISTP
jgi:hypothetical protein